MSPAVLPAVLPIYSLTLLPLYYLLCLASELGVLPADCCGTCTCDRARGWVCSPGLGSGCCSEFWARAPAHPPGSCLAEWPACVARVCHRSAGRDQRIAPPPTLSIAPVAIRCSAGIAEHVIWLHTVLYLDIKVTLTLQMSVTEGFRIYYRVRVLQCLSGQLPDHRLFQNANESTFPSITQKRVLCQWFCVHLEQSIHNPTPNTASTPSMLHDIKET